MFYKIQHKKNCYIKANKVDRAHYVKRWGEPIKTEGVLWFKGWIQSNDTFLIGIYADSKKAAIEKYKKTLFFLNIKT